MERAQSELSSRQATQHSHSQSQEESALVLHLSRLHTPVTRTHSSYSQYCRSPPFSTIDATARPLQQAALPSSSLCNVHEDVLPPIPLPPVTPLSPPSLAQPLSCPWSRVQRSSGTGWTPSPACVRGGARTSESSQKSRCTSIKVSLSRLTSPSATSYVNTPSVVENADAVRTRLREYMQFGATRLPADTPLLAEGLCIQPLHVIIKAGRKPRLVIDLSRNLNDHLQYESFRYSSVDDAVEASFPGGWYGKLDLSNYFVSFPLHPSVRKHFCFRFEGVLYQFTAMPFGLSTAPRVCTQLLSVIQFALAEQGITDIRYLDDFFLIAKLEKDMARDLRIAQSVIRPFGLVVNPDKTDGPAQQLSFLGVQLDSVAQTVSCTPERVEELTTLLRSFLRQRVITRAHTASLIGKLSFATQLLPGARPFMRRLLDTLLQCKSRRHSAPVRIDPAFRDDVRFWVQQLHLWNGRQQWRASRASPFVFASDASLRGFSFYLESTPTLPSSTVDSAAWPQHLRVGATFSGIYSPEHAHLHHSHTQIAWCKLFGGGCLYIYLRPVAGRSVHALLRRQLHRFASSTDKRRAAKCSPAWYDSSTASPASTTSPSALSTAREWTTPWPTSSAGPSYIATTMSLDGHPLTLPPLRACPLYPWCPARAT